MVFQGITGEQEDDLLEEEEPPPCPPRTDRPAAPAEAANGSTATPAAAGSIG
jgi:hypothetical protein